MSIPAGTIFPEIDAPAELASMLDRLQAGRLGAFDSLLAAAGPLCRPELLPQAVELRARLEGVLDLPQPFSPFLLHASSEALLWLRPHLTKQHHVEDAGSMVAHVAGQLSAQLHVLALRTLVAQLRKMSKADELAGDSPEERYEDFLRQSLTTDFECNLTSSFPLLVPSLRRASHRSVNRMLTMLQRLSDDWTALSNLGIASGDTLARVDICAGDSHSGGQTVMILDFASGRRLVYKPRDLSVDAAFQTVLQAVNEWSATDLRTCRVIVRDEYGWMEFIETAATAPAAELAYFERVGQLTALLHVLTARDMHHSNVVSDGRGPVAIDLETLLHPVFGVPGGPSNDPDSAYASLEESVWAIGILPTVVSNGDGGQIDLGGVGYRDGVRSPFKSIVVRNRGRDDMSLGLERQVLTGRHHAPTVSADAENVADIADAVDRGFGTVWAAMTAHRHELRDLVRREFTGARVRYIHNPTSLYSQLLRLVTHPNFVSDPADRLLALQRIGLSRSAADPELARCEIRDLAEGDIPYFSVVADQRRIDTSDGEAVGVLLDEAPLKAALRRIDDLGATQEDLQRRILRLSFVAKLPRRADRTTSADRTGVSRLAGTDGRGGARRLASSIADRFVAEQLPGRAPGEPASWIGPVIGTTVDEHAWFPGVLGTGLYNGSSGPALFLALMAQQTNSSRYAGAARAVLEPLAEGLTAGPADGGEPTTIGSPVGAFAGLSGPCYALAVAGDALQDPTLVAAAIEALVRIGPHLESDRSLDLIAGAAGLVATALALYVRAGTTVERSLCLAVAADAADHLVRVHPLAGGVAVQRSPGYTGYGHGTAGIHPYLRRLAVLLPSERASAWTTLAERLAAFTTEHFDPVLQDWHTGHSRDRRSYGWCHGAPGIGLSHALMDEAGLTAVAGAEHAMVLASSHILASGLGNNITYCHGDMGNIEILSRLAEAMGDRALRRTADQIAGQLVAEVLPRHLASGRSRYTQTGCLMLGTSGVGHFLLRQIEPLAVPSVLTLD